MVLEAREQLKRHARRLGAAAPALVAALGVAMAASSSPRPDIDKTAEAAARITRGDLTEKGMNALIAGLDPAQLALAIRHDPTLNTPALYGLTLGWESLGLAGKPSLDLGASGLDAHRLNAAMPVSSGALRAARPFVLKASVDDRRRALRCLTQAVYYEAALEPGLGQDAVAQVVLNRVRDPNYANSVCGVVFEGAERTTGCQFSFTCDGSLSQPPVKWAWDRAQVVAERALNGHVASHVGTATHYHADYVHPWWSPTLAKITQVGAHIFYRWKGVAGETAAFRQAYAGREPVIDEARFSRPRLIQAADAPVGDAAVVETAGLRQVEIDGQTRVVGVASLGGRRLPSREEVAAINARLKALETTPAPVAPAPAAAPPGAVPMAVEEVGRPAA